MQGRELQYGEGLAGLLGETIAALTSCDGPRLEGLQARAEAVGTYGFESEEALRGALGKRDVLEALLRGTRLNVDLLRRFEGGEARDRWER